MKLIIQCMKRIISAILAVICLSINAQDQLQDITIQMSSQIYRFNTGCGGDIANYSSIRTPLLSLAEPKDSAVRFIDRIYNMPENLIKFYNDYQKAVNDVLDGADNYLSDPTLAQFGSINESDVKGYYIPIKHWETPRYAFQYPTSWSTAELMDYLMTDFATDYTYLPEVQDTMKLFMPYLQMCLDYDNPQAFWTGYESSWHSSTAIQAQVGNGIVYCKFTYDASFILKYYATSDDNFDIRIEDYQDPAALKDAVLEYKQYVSDILDGMPAGSTYDKAKYLNDWLTNHNCYSTALGQEHEPDIIRSPMSALKGSVGDRGPVCEGYARAFKVLADAAGIPAILVIGDACSAPNTEREAHMWNEVRMDDNKWYGVDVTWNDPVVSGQDPQAQSGFETDAWFLVGKDTNIRGFAFSQSHPNQIKEKKGFSKSLNRLSCHLDTYLDPHSYLYNTPVNSTFIENPKYTVHTITGVYIGEFESLSDLPQGSYIVTSAETGAQRGRFFLCP